MSVLLLLSPEMVEMCKSEADGFCAPSSKAANWRRAKKARMSRTFALRHPLRQPLEMAEGVEFPEKNACFCQSRAPFGKEGCQVLLSLGEELAGLISEEA